jgi:HK97 family phage prohead protease
MDKMERFFFDGDLNLEKQEDKPSQIVGYAMKFNVLSHDRGGYRDVFRPDVFGDSVHGFDGLDTKAYYDHDTRSYLARVGNNSLRLSTDHVGLRFSLDIPDTQLGRDCATLLERGDIPGCSFGYVPDEFQWKDEETSPIREHTRGRLVEVSIVHDPAFPFTEVALASLEKWNRARAGTPNRNKAK